jgi:drug/metabolite transporter (DMT)-like permease
MLMFVVANIVGSTIQITTLPLPVLSTLQASGLVFNSICASVVLNEPFTRYSLVGTVLVAVGALMIGIFGSISEPSHNLDQLLELLWRRQFVLWMLATFVVVIALIAGNWFLNRIYPRQTPRLRLVCGIFFGCVSGILSAHSLLIAKSAVELLVRTIVDRHNQFDRWQSWMILIGLVAFALIQLYYMHRGLKLCSTSVLYPLIFCVYNVIAIIDGLIYFHQSSRLTDLHAGLLAVGTLILLGGVVCLSWRLEETDEEPTSPHVVKKGLGAMPQTALTPGIGLVHGTLDEEPTSPVDLEQQPPGLHGSDYEQRKRQSVDERTPLLVRAPTGPAITVTTRSKKSLPSNPNQAQSPHASPSSRRPPRRRRMTISEETNEIWNELNDRDTVPSPVRRSVDMERRPRSGTLPARRKNNSSSWLGQMRRPSWFDAIGAGDKRRSSGASQGKRPVDSSSSLINHPDPEDDTHSDPDAALSPVRRRGTWGYSDQSSRRNKDSLGEWFKLKFWRTRWKEGDGGNHEGE